MTAVHNAKCFEMRRSAQGVCLTGHTHAGATIVGATGELDASNIHHLTDFARSCRIGGRALILDFSQLDFLGAQGIRSLFEIADECDQSGTEWAMVPGHAVSRLLRICDTEARVPTVSSIDDALERFSASSRARRLLQLVTKSG